MRQIPLRNVLAGFVVTLVVGCSILPKSDPVAVYQLPFIQGARPQTAIGADSKSQRSLRILTPYSSQILNSDRILVLPENNLVQSYAGARWSDSAPVLLRNYLMQAFTADGRIPYLSGDDSNVQASQELGGELRAFQTEYQQGVPGVVIIFNARVIDTASKRIVAVRSFTIRQPVSGDKIPGVVNAFGQASQSLSTSVIAWVTSLPTAQGK